MRFLPLFPSLSYLDLLDALLSSPPASELEESIAGLVRHADMARRAGSRRIAGLSADNTPDAATAGAAGMTGSEAASAAGVGGNTSTDGNVGEDVAAEALELYREALDGYSLVLAAAATSPMTDKWAQWASLAHYGRAVIFHWLEV